MTGERQAEQTAARAADASTLKEAENEVSRARLAVATNRILPTVEAEKNDLAIEQALARLAQLSNTCALKRQAVAAVRILEIRRARAPPRSTSSSPSITNSGVARGGCRGASPGAPGSRAALRRDLEEEEAGVWHPRRIADDAGAQRAR